MMNSNPTPSAEIMEKVRQRNNARNGHIFPTRDEWREIAGFCESQQATIEELEKMQTIIIDAHHRDVENLSDKLDQAREEVKKLKKELATLKAVRGVNERQRNTVLMAELTKSGLKDPNYWKRDAGEDEPTPTFDLIHSLHELFHHPLYGDDPEKDEENVMAIIKNYYLNTL